jgi:hypothetical protein
VPVPLQLDEAEATPLVQLAVWHTVVAGGKVHAPCVEPLQ